MTEKDVSFSAVLSLCLNLRARQTCWSTRRTRHWTPCARFTVQLSPVALVKMEQFRHSSSTILTNSHSRSRYSNSLRLSPTHSPHQFTSPKFNPKPRSHLRPISIPFPCHILNYQPSLWFKLFWNHRPILNPHLYPSLNFSSRASSRGQQRLSTPSLRKRRSVMILWDPADPQPVPTENPTQRETVRVRQIWRSRRVEKKGWRPVMKEKWRK